MITLRQVVLQRGEKRLLDGVDLTIVPRQKIGVLANYDLVPSMSAVIVQFGYKINF